MKASQVDPQEDNNHENQEKLRPQLTTVEHTGLVKNDSKQAPSDKPIVRYSFLSFTQFVHSLPKISTVEQTKTWVLKCAEYLGEHGRNLDDDSLITLLPDRCSETELNEIGQGLSCEDLRSNRKSFVPSIECNNDLLSDCKGHQKHSDDEAKTNHEQKSSHRLNEEEIPLLMSSSRASMNSLELPCSSTISSAGSSNSMSNSDQFVNMPEEFVCCWNTCYHKETSVDKIFHHILHSHLHRTTDFHSSRCLWRGCSRDGILKKFTDRHQLFIHVGIHCQKLKEPNLVSTSVLLFF